MSRVYVMDHNTPQLLELVEESDALYHVHKPLVEDPVTGQEEESLWPDGVRDSAGNHGWFEDGMVLFWGLSEEQGILEEFQRKGVKIVDSF